MTHFDIKDDLAKIAVGTHFWCSGHLGTVPSAERSLKDSRYCVVCQKGVEEGYREAGQLRKYLVGIPKPATVTPATKPAPQPCALSASDGPGADDTATTSDITTAKNKGVLVHLKGGRPKKDVPLDLIKQLHDDGDGVRGIARQLKLSPMTVSRVISAGMK